MFAHQPFLDIGYTFFVDGPTVGSLWLQAAIQVLMREGVWQPMCDGFWDAVKPATVMMTVVQERNDVHLIVMETHEKV